MHSHGPRCLRLGETRRLYCARGAVGARKVDQHLPIGFPGHAYIAIEHMRAIVVGHNHHRTPVIPAFGDHGALTAQPPFHFGVHARHPPRAFAFGAEHPEPVEGGKRGRRRLGRQTPFKMRHQQRQQLGAITRRRRPAHIGARGIVHDGRERRCVAGENRGGRGADGRMGFEPEATGEALHAGVERTAATDLVRHPTDRPQHVAGFHAGQLILITHQQERGVRRECGHERIHQQHVHHARFIENHQVIRQRRALARPEAITIGLIAQ